MKHVRIIVVVFALALAIAWSGCVDSDSDKQEESQGDGAPSGTAHYLDLIDVTSLHYKATVSADGEDTAVFEEWRKKSGDVWFFKLVLSSNQGADSMTILQNADGMYMVDEESGTAIKTGECSEDNLGFGNPFWAAYGCYSDDSAWDDSWITDSDATYLGRKAVKLDYSRIWQLAGALSREDIDTERADLIVDKQTGFTLLLDWACTHKGEYESMHYEVTEFDVDTNIPDDMFDLPAGAEVVDLTALGEMGGEMGGEMPDEMSGMASGGPGTPPLPE
jgi:outer membrane lipoprotein-sorting protein